MGKISSFKEFKKIHLCDKQIEQYKPWVIFSDKGDAESAPKGIANVCDKLDKRVGFYGAHHQEMQKCNTKR